MPTPASPGTNRFRCDSCGRYFNTEQELKEHSRECAAAQQSGATPVQSEKKGPGEDREWVSKP